MAKYEPEEQTVVKPGDTVDLSRGQLECTWTGMDDYANHIIHYMAMIWKNLAFPNGYIYNCRPCASFMKPNRLTYALRISTPHCSAKAIDWSKAEWTVNIVGKPQLKIKGDSISKHSLYGEHVGWIILFYVDVLDVVKPEDIVLDKPLPEIMPFSVKEEVAKSVERALKYIDTDIALTRAAYKRGGKTMNKYEIEVAIRDGGYTDYQRNIIKGFLLRNGLLSNDVPRPPYEKYYGIRKDLRPSPKKVIYNGPATVVIFEDGSKTVVKLQDGEQMDREKAVYAAICKRMFGSNKNRSNWLDMLKPLMKSADEVWRVKLEKDALNASIKEYSGRTEFSDSEDAAGFISLIGVLKDKYGKREKTIANVLRYPGVSALRKAVKAAREVVKDGKES